MFDSLNDIVSGIIEHGDIVKKEKIGQFEFTIKPLSTEDLIVAQSINILREIRESTGAEGMESFNDVFETARLISTASYFVVEMNGVVIHDPKDSTKEKHEKAKELRKILMKIPPATMNKLNEVYREAIKERNDLIANLEETVGK